MLALSLHSVEVMDLGKNNILPQRKEASSLAQARSTSRDDESSVTVMGSLADEVESMEHIIIFP